MSFDSEPSQRAAFLKNEVEEEFDSLSLPHRRWNKAKQCILLRTSSWPWVLSTMVFACTTALLLLRTWTATEHHVGRLPCDDDPGGLPVALGVGNKRISMEFTGGLTYNSSGSLIAEYVPGQRRWSGKPSPTMDEAWEDLEEFWVVLLDGEEADNVRGKTLLQDGYWVTGLDVMHQMHCLDSLRRLIYPDYYPRKGSPRNWELHINHCVDYLRQAITCHGDTNPVRYKWHDGINSWGPDFATSRYCPRVMDDLVEWSEARTPKARAGTMGKERIVMNGVVVADMEEEGNKLDLEAGRSHHHGR